MTSLRGTSYKALPLTLYPPPHGKKEILELLERIEKEIAGQVRKWRTAGT
jgi:hypothetical protein